MGWRRAAAGVLLLLATPAIALAQDLGHKMNGGLGLHAGDAPEPGLAAAGLFLDYRAGELRNRNGQRIPVTANLEADAAMIGASGTFMLGATRISAAVAVPFAHITVDTDRPETSVDVFGLGDLFVQPLELGWRWRSLDLVFSYGFYAPTGKFEPGGKSGVGQGQWSHQLSAGGTVFFDSSRRVRLSALAAYNLYQQKQAIDITRGDSVQIQGGAGVTLLRILDAGVVGYALWQVRDDRGAALPPVLRGAHDRAFGLGPEVGVRIPAIRTGFSLRYEYDFAVESRPLGDIFVFTATWLAWRPSAFPAITR